MTAINTPVGVVICRCDPSTQCPHASPTCVSTTGCFHSLRLDSDFNHVAEETHGCFPNNTNQVDLHCRHPDLTNPLVFCCTVTDGDLCNENLAPSLPRTPISAFFAFRNYTTLTLVVVLPLLTLIFGLLAIGMFWHCVLRARLRRYRLPFEKESSRKYRKKCSIITCNAVCHSLKKLLCRSYPSNVPPLEEHLALNPTEKTLRVLANYTSGSGSGLPFLVQRTIARHIQLHACIGTGRFGEVWRGTYQEETVAVKIFSSRDEASWARETEVYSTGLFHHPNLLAYYASDMISRGGCTQLWLITAYHANGSLYDYLNQSTVDLRDCLKIARSISAGLAFLHSEIRGVQFKPAIAHRDIKSKNILIRDDKEACIADLGLAMIHSKPESMTQCSSINYGGEWSMTNSDGLTAGLSGPSSFGPPQPPCPRVGTKRYMAPELLIAVVSARQSNCQHLEKSEDLSDDTFEQPSLPYLPFEMYQAADVYAMSLVFWELLRCTHGLNSDCQTVEGYQIPFYDLVPADPTFVQMKNVVCGEANSVDLSQHSKMAEGPTASTRPLISPRWMVDPCLSRLVVLIQECWHADWASRLSALRVRKKLELFECGLSQQYNLLA